jgi:hypothetical protein
MLTLLVVAEAVLCLDDDFGQGMLGDGVTHRPHRLLMRIPQHGLPSLRRAPTRRSAEESGRPAHGHERLARESGPTPNAIVTRHGSIPACAARSRIASSSRTGKGSRPAAATYRLPAVVRVLGGATAPTTKPHVDVLIGE